MYPFCILAVVVVFEEVALGLGKGNMLALGLVGFGGELVLTTACLQLAEGEGNWEILGNILVGFEGLEFDAELKTNHAMKFLSCLNHFLSCFSLF